MTYCFKCNQCYAQFESVLVNQRCPNCQSDDVRRDYRAENAGLSLEALRAARKGGPVKTEKG